MNRQGYMLHLSNVDATTWRATFGREPMLSSDGFGTGATPWRAVRVAAWTALVDYPGVSKWGVMSSSSSARNSLAARSPARSDGTFEANDHPVGPLPRHRRKNLI